jgi:hypothetical protein
LSYIEEVGHIGVDLSGVELEALIDHTIFEEDDDVEEEHAKGVLVLQRFDYRGRFPPLQDHSLLHVLTMSLTLCRE